MGPKRKRFRCGWRTLWVLAVCMVEIGRVGVKGGNAPIEQKISAYPPQADICAFVSTSLETKRAARLPSQGSGRPKRNGSGWLRTALGRSKGDMRSRPDHVCLPPNAEVKDRSAGVLFGQPKWAYAWRSNSGGIKTYGIDPVRTSANGKPSQIANRKRQRGTEPLHRRAGSQKTAFNFAAEFLQPRSRIHD